MKQTFVEICYMCGDGERKIKQFIDTSDSVVGYRLEESTVTIWSNREDFNDTWIFPVDRVEYVREYTK